MPREMRALTLNSMLVGADAKRSATVSFPHATRRRPYDRLLHEASASAFDVVEREHCKKLSHPE